MINSAVKDFKIKWIIDHYPSEFSTWNVSFIKPTNFLITEFYVSGPNNLSECHNLFKNVNLKYCKGIKKPTRTYVSVAYSTVTMHFPNLTLSDIGYYNWTVTIKDQPITIQHNVSIIVKVKPRLFYFNLYPKLLDYYEGDIVNLTCNLSTGHIPQLSQLILVNEKYAERRILKKNNYSNPIVGEMFNITLSASFSAVDGDSYALCQSVNIFGQEINNFITFTVQVVTSFNVKSNFKIFCFIDFTSLYINYKLNSSSCYKNNRPYIKQKYFLERYFVMEIKNSKASDSGKYYCKLNFTHLNKPLWSENSVCSRQIIIITKMKILECTINETLIANDMFIITSVNDPGYYWTSTVLNILMHDIPRTWFIKFPLADNLKLNATHLISRIKYVLPSAPKYYKSVNVCCILNNKDHIPTIVVNCQFKNVTHLLEGKIQTDPVISHNQRVPVSLIIKCYGVQGYPLPTYSWVRVSASKIQFQETFIPDLITNNQTLIIGTSIYERGNFYEYKCTVKQLNKVIDKSIKFFISLCDGEPLIDLNFAINTQIHTTCSVNNTQGSEFYNVIYKPFLQNLIQTLPITPKKTRISLTPFLNYRNNHNGSIISITKKKTSLDVFKYLDNYKTNYKSRTTLPCDAMELSCSGKAFYALFNNYDESARRANIPSVFITGIDTSACLNHRLNTEQLQYYVKQLHKSKSDIWLHLFSRDISNLALDIKYIKPEKIFYLVNHSFKNAQFGQCCEMLQYRHLFSLSGETFKRSICNHSVMSKNPSLSISLKLNHSILYKSLVSKVYCQGDAGSPGGKLKLCIARSPYSHCLYDLSKWMHNELLGSVVSIEISIEFLAAFEHKYLICIAMNNVLLAGYDPPYRQWILIKYFTQDMVFIQIEIQQEIIESKSVQINCTFLIPIPPPTIEIILVKSSLIEQKNILNKRMYLNYSQVMKIKNETLFHSELITIPNITNHWDQSQLVCTLKNSEEEMSDSKVFLIDWTLVKQPSLVIQYQRKYNDLQFNGSGYLSQQSIKFVQEGYALLINCSAKVGNGNTSLNLTIRKKSLYAPFLQQWWIINNNKDECQNHSAPQLSFKCREIRQITRNEDYREIIFIIPSVSKNDKLYTFICTANNSLNNLTNSTNLKVFLPPKIIHFHKQGQRILCTAVGNPIVNVYLKVTEVLPTNAIQSMNTTVNILHSQVTRSNYIIVSSSALIKFVCLAQNVILNKLETVSFEKDFLYSHSKMRLVELVIKPNISKINQDVLFSCSVNSELIKRVEQIVIAKRINSKLVDTQKFIVLIQSNFSLNSLPVFLNMWKNVKFVSKNVINNWINIYFQFSKRAESGYYYCGIVVGRSFEYCTTALELRIMELPTANVSFIVAKNKQIVTAVEGELVTICCSVNIGLDGNKGNITILNSNGILLPEDDIIKLIELDGSVTLLLRYTLLVTRMTTWNFVCQARNEVGYIKWPVKELNIFYAPISLKFVPSRRIFKSNEEILCYSFGNPLPNYYWTYRQVSFNQSTEYKVKSNKLSMKKLNNGFYLAECNATNIIGYANERIYFLKIQTNIHNYDSMKFEPKRPRKGNTINFWCLTFVEELEQDIIEMLTSIEWFKMIPPSNDHLKLITYNFFTMNIHHYVPSHRFIIQGPYNTLKLILINATVADFGYYGCTLLFSNNIKLTMITKEEVCILDQSKSTLIKLSNKCLLEKGKLTITCQGDAGTLMCGQGYIRTVHLMLEINKTDHTNELFQLDEANVSQGVTRGLYGFKYFKKTIFNFDKAECTCQVQTIIGTKKEIVSRSNTIKMCIYYGPRYMHIEPSVDNVRPGTKIFCSSLSNPPPIVEWINLPSNWTKLTDNTTHTAAFTVPLTAKLGLYKITCYSYNIVNNERLNLSQSVELTVINSRSYAKTLKAVLLSAIILFFCIIFLILAYFLKRVCRHIKFCSNKHKSNHFEHR